MKRDEINLDEEVPYTLRKEKTVFNLFIFSVVTGIVMVLLFLIMGYNTLQAFELLGKQDQRIKQLETKVSQLQDRH